MVAGAGLEVVVAETERLVLRRFAPQDVDALVALHGDIEVMQYVATPQTPVRVRDEVLPRYLEEYARFGGLGHWVAIERSTGGFVGWFALTPDARDSTIFELGYRLCRVTWGRGYATEGARAVLDLAFDEVGAEQVVAQTMTINTRSRAVMERLDMRFVRTFHAQWPEQLEGSEQGDVEYAIDRVDWLAGVS